MHFHLPKPLHGWREFLGEVGIVVIGVLIALGAEQVVEQVHNHSKVTENENALAAEVAENTAAAVIRLRLTECVDNRLDLLGAWLDRASAAHRLPALGPFGRVRQVPFTSATWTSFLSSPLATTLPRTQLAALRAAYGYSELLRTVEEQELEPWNVLWTMVGPGRSLSEIEEPQLRQALVKARSDNMRAGFLAADFVEAVRRTDLPFTNEQRERLAHVLREPTNKLDLTDLCAGAAVAAPPHYGSSPSSYFLPMAGEALRRGVQLGPISSSH